VAQQRLERHPKAPCYKSFQKIHNQAVFRSKGSKENDQDLSKRSSFVFGKSGNGENSARGNKEGLQGINPMQSRVMRGGVHHIHLFSVAKSRRYEKGLNKVKGTVVGGAEKMKSGQSQTIGHGAKRHD